MKILFIFVLCFWTQALVVENNLHTNMGYANKNKNSIQFMITNKMRKVLINELQYTHEEVDSMIPDVAVVIIEKNLRRPVNGMPNSWRRSIPGSQSSFALSKVLNKFKGSFSSVSISFTKIGMTSAIALSTLYAIDKLQWSKQQSISLFPAPWSRMFNQTRSNRHNIAEIDTRYIQMIEDGRKFHLMKMAILNIFQYLKKKFI